MKKKSRLLRKIVRLQKERNIIPEGSALLVALSGGVDSVVLVHSLLELREFLKVKRIGLAHFNHGIREDSDRDEEFCRKLALSLDLEFFSEKGDVSSVSQRERKNLEEKAREMRYRFLRRVKKREGFDLIATAHHLTDLLETVIIWITRGSGMEGLLGFSPVEGDVVRPLFTSTRREITDYAEVTGLRWIEDPTNLDLSLTRNRIRHRIIPVLREVNPSVEESFLRLWRILEIEDSFLREQTASLLERARRENCLEVKALKGSHIAVQKRALKEFFGIRNLSKLEQILNLTDKGGEVRIGRRSRAVRKGGLLCLKKDS